jgi:tetratricopeptide (TPR) repeat protein
LIEKRQCGSGSNADGLILQGNENCGRWEIQKKVQQIKADGRILTRLRNMDLEEKAEKARENGDLDTACVLWKEIATRNQNAPSFVSYGRLATKLEKWDEAESALAQALLLDPGFSVAMVGMGILWYRRTDREETECFQTARDWYLRAIELDCNASVLTLLGCSYMALGDSLAAQHAFEGALKIDPRYEEAIFNLASLRAKSDPTGAAELLERAIEIDGDYSLAHQQLGVLRHRSGDLIQAEYHFRRSLEADPTDYWSHLYLANCLAVQGREAEAEQTYRFVTSLQPENEGGLRFFANFLESIGKRQEASVLRAKIKSV